MEPLTPQDEHVSNVELWTDERIYGHRFHNDQTPWLALLELLALFRDRHRASRAFSEPPVDNEHEKIRYDLLRLGPLRYLVFNNPHLQHIEQTVQGNEARWRRWLESVQHNPLSVDFSYLRDRFEQFSRLVRVVEFYQGTAVEGHRRRRWTSRFLFPYGPDCLYADVDEKRGFGTPDRRFFARGGELLYLMLNRSGRGEELASRVADRLLNPRENWNRIVRALLPESYEIDRNVVPQIPIGYLPYPDRREYTALADDWLALLRLRLPGAALLDPLVRISALHALLYMLRRSHEELGDGEEPRFALEIAAPRKTLLFDLSSESYNANRMLPRRAVETHVESARRTDGWRQALSARDAAREAFSFLQQTFHWKRKDQPGGDADKVLEALVDDAVSRHNQHVNKVGPEWSRRIGLLTSRRGAGTWYSPDDAFLKAIVMASVRDREEYHRFLAKVYRKYRIVIGVAEAEQAYGGLPVDERVLTENAARLEQRLRTLGLLTRLSDDCAYVTNPFQAAE